MCKVEGTLPEYFYVLKGFLFSGERRRGKKTQPFDLPEGCVLLGQTDAAGYSYEWFIMLDVEVNKMGTAIQELQEYCEIKYLHDF